MKIIFKISVWAIGITLSVFFLGVMTLHIPSLIPSAFTVYSEDFNKLHYEKIKIGADRIFVESQIGKPLRESEDNYFRDSIMDISWYTKNKIYGLSYERILIIYYEDKVVSKINVVDMD